MKSKKSLNGLSIVTMCGEKFIKIGPSYFIGAINSDAVEVRGGVKTPYLLNEYGEVIETYVYNNETFDYRIV